MKGNHSWSAAISVGQTATNSQCIVSPISAATNSTVNDLSVTFPTILNPSFAGPKNVYLLAIDAAYANTGWTLHGTCIVPCAPITSHKKSVILFHQRRPVTPDSPAQQFLRCRSSPLMAIVHI